MTAISGPNIRIVIGPSIHHFCEFIDLAKFSQPPPITLLSIAHALHFYRRSQERERRALELTARLAQSRLEALKMQLARLSAPPLNVEPQVLEIEVALHLLHHVLADRARVSQLEHRVMLCVEQFSSQTLIRD